MEGYSISTDKSLLDHELIHYWLSKESYWSADISRERVDRFIEATLCFGVYHEGRQVGFAKIITDYSSIAYIADVFILAEHQGKGLGKALIRNILEHAELQPVKRWLLATKDAHGLYEQFGFRPITNVERWMEKPVFDSYKDH